MAWREGAFGSGCANLRQGASWRRCGGASPRLLVVHPGAVGGSLRGGIKGAGGTNWTHPPPAAIHGRSGALFLRLAGSVPPCKGPRQAGAAARHTRGTTTPPLYEHCCRWHPVVEGEEGDTRARGCARGPARSGWPSTPAPCCGAVMHPALLVSGGGGHPVAAGCARCKRSPSLAQVDVPCSIADGLTAPRCTSSSCFSSPPHFRMRLDTREEDWKDVGRKGRSPLTRG